MRRSLITPAALHLRAQRAIIASKLITQEVQCSLKAAHDLIQIGAVYRQTDLHMKPMRILEDVSLNEGDYVRVFSKPKRYNIVNDWKGAIVHDEKEFLLINKPAGLPTVPTGDNYYENLVTVVKVAMGVPDLYPPHRLDAATSGLVLLTKTRRYCALFGKLLQRRDVVKKYRALLAFHAPGKGIAAPTDVMEAFRPGRLLRSYKLKSRGTPRLYVPHTDDYDDGNATGNSNVDSDDSSSTVSVPLAASRNTGTLCTEFNSIQAGEVKLLNAEAVVCNRSVSASKTPREWRQWLQKQRQQQQQQHQQHIQDSEFAKFDAAFSSWLDCFEVYAGSVSGQCQDGAESPQSSNSESGSAQGGAKVLQPAAVVTSVLASHPDLDLIEPRLAFLEVELELLTGRTHQLRGQVQAAVFTPHPPKYPKPPDVPSAVTFPYSDSCIKGSSKRGSKICTNLSCCTITSSSSTTKGSTRPIETYVDLLATYGASIVNGDEAARQTVQDTLRTANSSQLHIAGDNLYTGCTSSAPEHRQQQRQASCQEGRDLQEQDASVTVKRELFDPPPFRLETFTAESLLSLRPAAATATTTFSSTSQDATATATDYATATAARFITPGDSPHLALQSFHMAWPRRLPQQAFRNIAQDKEEQQQQQQHHLVEPEDVADDTAVHDPSIDEGFSSLGSDPREYAYTLVRPWWSPLWKLLHN